MEIRQMQVLTTVVSAGNLSAAAEKLYVTPQALSKTIAQLEQTLDVPLFERRKNKLIPTAVGLQIANECAAFLKEYQQLQMRIRSHVHRERGEFHVAMAQGALMMLGETLFEDFSAAYPQYSPRYLDFPDQIAEDWLLSGRSLLAMTTSVPEDDAYEAIELRRNELCAVLNAAHPLAAEDEVTLEQLSRYALLTKNSLFTSYHALERAAQRKGLRLQYALSSNDDVHWTHMVRENRGVGIGVLGDGRRIPSLPDIVYRPIVPRIPWTLYLCYRKEHAASAPVSAFVNFLAARTV